MRSDWPSLVSLAGFVVLSLLLLAGHLWRAPWRASGRLRVLWLFCLVIAAAQWRSFPLASWLLAGCAFFALREYFSLVDIRLQDRGAVLAAYLCVPGVAYLTQIDWYGLFIISIPVYAFLVVPLLVALGGRETKGALLSVGIIDFGLFLFAYCLGHAGYLLRFSPGLAVFLAGGVALCDLVDARLRGRRGEAGRESARGDAGGVGRGAGRRALLSYLAAAPLSLALALATAARAGVPAPHAAGLGLLLPALVLAGNVTMAALEQDLGIEDGELAPGQGQLFDALKAYLFAAPVVFHYVRYFTDLI